MTPLASTTAAPPDAVQSTAYDTVAQAIRFVREHAAEQPALEVIAAQVGLSPVHLQRLFTEWAGVSPKRFLQYLTAEHARSCLAHSASVVEAAAVSGLSSPGRLYDLLLASDGLTPGQMRARGAGLTMRWGVGPTPFGDALVVWTERGVCQLEFCQDLDRGTAQARLEALTRRYPLAVFGQDAAEASTLLSRVFEPARQGREHQPRLALQGTNFQLRVWSALLNTAPGQRLSYGQLAAMAGSPGAQRAVGTALASNVVGYLIPCHRVIRESGEPGQYRWGLDRKMALLAWECARRG